MRKIIFSFSLFVLCLLINSHDALAECKGKFRMEFGYTSDALVVMKRNMQCIVGMEFDGVALYGLSVRQSPRNGTVQIHQRGFVYTPRKGFSGTDQFIIDAEGGNADWQTGTVAKRSKAGMAVRVAVE
jgi:hypothetical protein